MHADIHADLEKNDVYHNSLSGITCWQVDWFVICQGLYVTHSRGKSLAGIWWFLNSINHATLIATNCTPTNLLHGIKAIFRINCAHNMLTSRFQITVIIILLSHMLNLRIANQFANQTCSPESPFVAITGLVLHLFLSWMHSFMNQLVHGCESGDERKPTKRFVERGGEQCD